MYKSLSKTWNTSTRAPLGDNIRDLLLLSWLVPRDVHTICSGMRGPMAGPVRACKHWNKVELVSRSNSKMQCTGTGKLSLQLACAMAMPAMARRRRQRHTASARHWLSLRCSMHACLLAESAPLCLRVCLALETSQPPLLAYDSVNQSQWIHSVPNFACCRVLCCTTLSHRCDHILLAAPWAILVACARSDGGHIEHGQPSIHASHSPFQHSDSFLPHTTRISNAQTSYPVPFSSLLNLFLCSCFLPPIFHWFCNQGKTTLAFDGGGGQTCMSTVQVTSNNNCFASARLIRVGEMSLWWHFTANNVDARIWFPLSIDANWIMATPKPY